MTNAVAVGLSQDNNGGAVAPFVAGKNKIINGDFGVWQRGTSFSLTNSTTYIVDRWRTYRDGSGATLTASQQTFTPGTAPVAGYEGTYFLRFAQTVAGTGGSYNVFTQPIEDVRVFAGQTVTLSFWAKADATRSLNANIIQNFGTGGSSAIYNGTTVSLSTSWQRFTYTLANPSISGKTIGTNSFLDIRLDLPVNATFTIDIWGVQLEAGSVATPFTTATGTVQGELAACQRYYFRNTGGGVAVYNPYANGGTVSTTGAYISFPFPQQMRVAPLAIEFSGIAVQTSGGTLAALSTLNLDQVSGFCASLAAITASSWLANQPCRLINNNNANGYVGFTSEF